MGNIKVANMLALGSLLAATKILRLESALAAINDIAPEDKKGLVAINQSALRKGMRL
jgi:2-oxoglutarate ferredoxin oxidoreductase subunit gamma